MCGVQLSRWWVAASSSTASATSSPSWAEAVASSAESVVLVWWSRTSCHDASSTSINRRTISSSRSGARCRAASRHMSIISTSANSDSVPPQSNTTASITGPSIEAWSLVRVRVLLARLQPPAEAGRVGVHAVQRLQLLAVRVVDTRERAGERVLQGSGDVAILPPRLLGHFRPLPQRVLGLLEDRRRIRDQAVVGQGDPGGTAGGELVEGVQRLVEVEVGRGRGRAQHAGVGQPHTDGVAGKEEAAL